MSNNTITTQSYSIMRLRNVGYDVVRIENLEYSKEDKRKWTILIDNGNHPIFLTCYKNDLFQLYDGSQYITGKHTFKWKIESIEVIMELLNDLGLVHKHSSYCSKKNNENNN